MEPLHGWFQHLKSDGNKDGYVVNSSKAWLIVKPEEIEAEAKEIFGNSVNITIEGKRHLGAVLGTKEYEDEFCKGYVTLQYHNHMQHSQHTLKDIGLNLHTSKEQ